MYPFCHHLHHSIPLELSSEGSTTVVLLKAKLSHTIVPTASIKSNFVMATPNILHQQKLINNVSNANITPMNITDPPLPRTKRHQRKQTIALRASTPYSTKYSGAVRYLDQMKPIHTAFALGGTNTNHPQFALASGRIWDDKLKKFAAWKDLVNHPDDTIASS